MVQKLSNRLACISDMVGNHYNHIWDCCCDHGQLGIALMQLNQVSTIHFVDRVKPLIDSLTSELEQQSCHNRWQTHCTDLNLLKLPEEEAKQLVIIAGVGGDLTIQLVRSLLSNNPRSHIEFILCPVRHNYQVRRTMSELGYGLINESLVYEKGLFYEVMHIGFGAIEAISATGSLMWDFSDASHQLYLRKNIEHYQRASRCNPSKYTDILHAYQLLHSL